MLKPKICVPVTGKNLDEFLNNLESIQKISDYIELRVDYIDNLTPTRLQIIKEKTYKKAIFTCRPTWEGGEFKGSDEERLGFIKNAITLDFDYVDIELETYTSHREELDQTIKNKKNTLIIISKHNFKETPSNCQLKKILKDLRKTKAEVIKFASMCNSELDSQRLLKLIANKKINEKIIILGMGEFGKPARVTGPVLGGYLTFASFNGQATASGQIDIEALQKIYTQIIQ